MKIPKYRTTTRRMFGIVGALAIFTASAANEQAARSAPVQDGEPASTTRNEVELRPRFTLTVDSVERLIVETNRSHASAFQRQLVDVALQAATQPLDDEDDTIDPEELVNTLKMIKGWPDTSVEMALFAPDREGRTRWTILLDWSLDLLLERVKALQKTKLGSSFFEDVMLRPSEDGVIELVLPHATVATLRSVNGKTLISSDAQLQHPSGNADSEGNSGDANNGAPVFKCALYMSGTEKDSGATFLSKFSAITGADFEAFVDDSGQWNDRLQIHWPPVTGTGVKMVTGQVKHSFYVPGDAFGALVANSMMIPGMLEGMAGFGPQVMMTQPGKMEVVGEMQIGPIARHSSPTVCVSLLPGSGFFPMPDIVIQSRAKSPELFEKTARGAIEKVNKTYRDREQAEPWHEVTIRGKTVFWSEGSSGFPGAVMPLIMRPVLFLTKEMDAKDKERDYLVMGWTSTSPEGFVKEWLNKPRTVGARHLPSKRKTNGQMWVHWSQLYKWLHPYMNIAMSSSGMDVLLPFADELKENLSDAMLSTKVKYTGMSLTHTGPFPLGTIAVPALMTAAIGTDESGSSDLSRERLASRHLRVLYHHSTLFKKDHDRWPAEVAELDGYVDFAGHPQLLKLKLSSKQKWGDWFGSLLGGKKEDKEEVDEEEDPLTSIDDDLYVIDWGKDNWRLGFAPGTLVHLESLYIDQDGLIHRTPKKETSKDDEDSDTRAEAKENDAGDTVKKTEKQAVSNLDNRYP